MASADCAEHLNELHRAEAEASWLSSVINK